MPIARSLEKAGKSTTWSVKGPSLMIAIDGEEPTTRTFRSEAEAGDSLIELTRTRLKQGWVPTTKPTAVTQFVTALEKARVRMWTYVNGLTDDELAIVYRQAIKEGENISLEVLRRRPTRELFAAMIPMRYPAHEFVKAVKFLAKDPVKAAWMLEEFTKALENGIDDEATRKFAERSVKRLQAGPKKAPVAPKKSVGDEASLLAAIAANPTDDAPRLVYADFLLEHGSQWGEYIQLACKAGQLVRHSPEWLELSTRLDKLEKKYAKDWLAPIRPFIRSWEFDRGLLSLLQCDAQLFAEAGEAIALRSPRAAINLVGLKKSNTSLAAAPLGAFQRVNLDSQRVDAAMMTALAASASIAGVEEWNLSENQFGDAGLEAIANSPNFAACTFLDLKDLRPSFTAPAVRSLLASKKLPKLTQLKLGLSGPGLASVFDGCQLSLTFLQLSIAGPVSPEDLLAIAQASSLKGLQSLVVQQTWQGAAPPPNSVTEKSLAAVIEALPKLYDFTAPMPLPTKLATKLELRAPK